MSDTDIPIVSSSHVLSIDIDGVKPRVLKVGPTYVLMTSGNEVTEFIPIGGIEGIYYSETEVYLRAISTGEMGDGLRFEWQNKPDNEHSLKETLKIICEQYEDVTDGMKLKVSKGTVELMRPFYRFPDPDLVHNRFMDFIKRDVRSESFYDDTDSEKESVPIITSSMVYSIDNNGEFHRKMLRVGPKYIFMVESGNVTEYVLIKDLDRHGCFWFDQQASLNIKPSRKRNSTRTLSACRERGLFFKWTIAKEHTHGLVETLKIISDCYKNITKKNLTFYKGVKKDMFPKTKIPNPREVSMSLAMMLESDTENETIGEWFVRQDIFQKKPSQWAAKYLASRGPTPSVSLNKLRAQPARAPPLQGRAPPDSLLNLRLKLGSRFETLLDSPEDLPETISLANKLMLSGAAELVCQPLKGMYPSIPYEYVTNNYIQIIRDHALRGNADPTAKYLDRIKVSSVEFNAKIVSDAFETLRNPTRNRNTFRDAAAIL